MVPRDVPPQ
jgi:hypothetical protein